MLKHCLLLGVLMATSAAWAKPAKAPAQWAGECCNAWGACLQIKADDTQIQAVSPNMPSINRFFKMKPQRQGTLWRYGELQLLVPTAEKDGQFQLEDQRTYTCYYE